MVLTFVSKRVPPKSFVRSRLRSRSSVEQDPQGLRRPRFSFFNLTCQTARRRNVISQKGRNLYLQIFQSEIHQAASSGCQRPEGSEPVDPPEEGSNLFFGATRRLFRSKQPAGFLQKIRQTSLQKARPIKPTNFYLPSLIGWSFTHRIEEFLNVGPSRTRGPRRRRAQWPGYRPPFPKLSTPDRQKFVTRSSCVEKHRSRARRTRLRSPLAAARTRVLRVRTGLCVAACAMQAITDRP